MTKINTVLYSKISATKHYIITGVTPPVLHIPLHVTPLKICTKVFTHITVAIIENVLSATLVGSNPPFGLRKHSARVDEYQYICISGYLLSWLTVTVTAFFRC